MKVGWAQGIGGCGAQALLKEEGWRPYPLAPSALLLPAGSSLALTSGTRVYVTLRISSLLWQTPHCWFIGLTSAPWFRRQACSMWMKLFLQIPTYQVITAFAVLLGLPVKCLPQTFTLATALFLPPKERTGGSSTHLPCFEGRWSWEYVPLLLCLSS